MVLNHKPSTTLFSKNLIMQLRSIYYKGRCLACHRFLHHKNKRKQEQNFHFLPEPWLFCSLTVLIAVIRGRWRQMFRHRWNSWLYIQRVANANTIIEQRDGASVCKQTWNKTEHVCLVQINMVLVLVIYNKNNRKLQEIQPP